ncbi:hypothetical protein PLESTB_000068400 [Pleodorina starrii]|uniref:Prefoldin subunit 4 n=1 Tax=Pleodorina starrii TaxID=330485 RepID=A0A9W6B9X2_9CHLO|nr:hypothetical protein PLESTM_001604900 [Pleodorina starrii]GLC48184.1 hypothetical protein PLESTB_000068400 [Pleodorina starrii]GLC67430.1 hypothetical protein PLESTF_000555400 [Pleodorina starrii]
MAAKAQTPQIEVLAEDQQRINMFSRLYTKMHDLERLLKHHKNELEELEDAGNELMLSDEDNVRFVVGECLVHFDKDAAEGRLEQVTQDVNKEMEKTTAELEEVKAKLKDLKSTLYAKFGKQINLEEDS